MKICPSLAALGLGAALLSGGAPLALAGEAPTPAAPAVTPSGEAGILEIEETVFDAGTVDRGTDVRHAFTLKNVGTSPLNVTAKPG